MDAVVARAVARGATMRRAPQDQFYGDRDGFVVDPFGHGWVTATHVADVSPEERQLSNARKFVEPYGGVVAAEFFDIGQSRSVPWERRREGAPLLAALKDPRRTWTGVVSGATRSWWARVVQVVTPGHGAVAPSD